MLASGFVGKRTAKLPSLDHLTMEDFDNVYEPSDDTYLLCDAIENDREHLSIMQPKVVLEVGCGSGCVITFLSMLLKEEGIPAVSLATDINPFAAACARRTAAANNVHVDVVLTNLVAAVHERLYHKVDVLLFNPPYVPTPSEEIGTLWLPPHLYFVLPMSHTMYSFRVNNQNFFS